LKCITDRTGPATAAIAQVSVDVGGQMEDGFRAARHWSIACPLSSWLDCYVRLKHAIDG
jgi:hypothetical protein